MSSEGEWLLTVTAGAQFGLFTPQQSLAAGIGAYALRHRVRSGRYEVIVPGVLAVAGTPHSVERDLMAASLKAGPGAVVSHRAAARLHGCDGFSNPPIEISSPNNTFGRGIQLSCGHKAIVHRVDGRVLEEITECSGIPVTTPRRTVLDLCGMKHPRAERALDSLLHRDQVTLGQLWLLLDKEWTRGRRGVAILRDLLVQRTLDRAPTQSDLELMLRRIIRLGNLPPPEQQYPVQLPREMVHLDFAYPAAKLAIETDGYAWHMDREAFERDRQRDLELTAMGWTVLRLTWAMLRYQEERVVVLLRHHLSLSTV